MYEPKKTLTIEIPMPSVPESVVDHCRANARFEMQLAQRMGEDHPGQLAYIELANIFLEIADGVEAEMKVMRAALLNQAKEN